MTLADVLADRKKRGGAFLVRVGKRWYAVTAMIGTMPCGRLVADPARPWERQGTFGPLSPSWKVSEVRPWASAPDRMAASASGGELDPLRDRPKVSRWAPGAVPVSELRRHPELGGGRTEPRRTRRR